MVRFYPYDKIQKSFLIAIVLSFAPSSLWADVNTGTLNVGVRVPGSCTLGASSYNLDFGDYKSSSSNDDAQVTLTTTCTSPLTSATLNLDGGANLSAPGSQQRRLKSGSNMLNYNLYKDAARGQLWNPSDKVAVSTSSTQTTTVYGRIPSGQTLSAGIYSDQINVTLEYN